MLLVAVPVALLAAAAFAVASVLQQRAARNVPADEALSPRLLIDLFRRPMWLLGIATAVASFVLQGIALAFGPLALVQPLVVCELLFALPLSVRLRRQRMGPLEWTGTIAVAGGLAAFLTAASPSAGTAQPGLIRWGEILGGVSAVAALAVAAGLRRTGPARATLFAVAAGTVFGLQAALTKTTTALFAQGPGTGFGSWEPYALAAVGAIGLLLGQSAFQAGPLGASLPVLDTLEPTVAVLIGAMAFGERIGISPVQLLLEALGVVALAAGIVVLDHSPLVRARQETTATPFPADDRARPLSSGPAAAGSAPGNRGSTG